MNGGLPILLHALLFKSHQFCDNADCSYYQKTNAGNIKIYSKKQDQVYCNVCKGRPFVVTKGTIFYWLKKPLELVVSTLMLLARGMGLNNTCTHQGVTADSVDRKNEYLIYSILSNTTQFLKFKNKKE